MLSISSKQEALAVVYAKGYKSKKGMQASKELLRKFVKSSVVNTVHVQRENSAPAPVELSS
jgi:DNA repair protein RadC